jgi:hypothetical protein
VLDQRLGRPRHHGDFRLHLAMPGQPDERHRDRADDNRGERDINPDPGPPGHHGEGAG